MTLKAEDISQEAPEVESDLYELLGTKRDASSDEIKSAYRRQALKHHPDKVALEAQEAAKEKFQELALAYAVLSDKRRRERYDLTGETTELLDSDENFSWREYFQTQYKDIITTEAIEKIKLEYQNSEEERTDLLTAYMEHEGDMDAIFEEIMCSSVLDDENRFRKILDAAIKKGEIPAYERYTKESKASRSRRQNAAKSEAAEAMEMAEEMGIADKLFGEDTTKKGKKASKKSSGDSEAALMSIIQQRQKDRSKTFLDDLEAKYTAKEAQKKASRKPKSGSRKRGSPDDDEENLSNEPGEEAFQAMAERGKRAKTARHGK